MVRCRLTTLIGILIVLFSGKVALGAIDKIMAVVNNEVITQKDVDAFAALMYLQHADEYTDKKELNQQMGKWRQEALERIIEERLIIQEAKKEKLTVEPQLIERRIYEIKSKFSSPEEFESALVADGVTMSDFRRKITEQLLMLEIIEVKIKNKIFVSPREITDYYEQHKKDLQSPEQAVVESIFIPVRESEAIAHKEAGEALRKLKAGEDFSVVSQEYSYAPSIGRVARGVLKKDIEEAIFKLKIGEHSAVIKTENGFYIFKLVDISPPQQLGLKEAGRKINQILSDEKFQQQFSQWMDNLKSKAYIHVK